MVHLILGKISRCTWIFPSMPLPVELRYDSRITLNHITSPGHSGCRLRTKALGSDSRVIALDLGVRAFRTGHDPSGLVIEWRKGDIERISHLYHVYEVSETLSTTRSINTDATSFGTNASCPQEDLWSCGQLPLQAWKVVVPELQSHPPAWVEYTENGPSRAVPHSFEYCTGDVQLVAILVLPAPPAQGTRASLVPCSNVHTGVNKHSPLRARRIQGGSVSEFQVWAWQRRATSSTNQKSRSRRRGSLLQYRTYAFPITLV